MRELIKLIAVIALAGGAAMIAPRVQADTGLVRLNAADDARAWLAVGRVNLGHSGFCTGSLIAPNLVLTAAHCVYDRASGDRIPADRIEFLAGWRNGRAVAARRARRVVVRDGYEYRSPDRMGRVANDLAVIELEAPIRNTQITPFRLARRPEVGDAVEVVSYAQDRDQAPSLQESCSVLGRDPGVLVLSCEVNFGASGSPIFINDRGEPRIASVVSAKAMWNQRKVALGTAIGNPLTEMIARLRESDGVFTRLQTRDTSTRAPALKPVKSVPGGAKFLRP